MTTPDPAAPETAAERTARQLSHLRILAELGMQLAQAAATLALADMAKPAEAEPVTFPEPAPDQAPGDAPGDAMVFWKLPTELPTPPRNPALLFTRLARAVRDCISLEMRIAAGEQQAAAALTDPRRPILRRALRQITADRPRPEIWRQRIDDRVDQELAADPFRQTPFPEILTLICEHLGLDPDEVAHTFQTDTSPTGFALSPEAAHQIPPHPDPSLPPSRH